MSPKILQSILTAQSEATELNKPTCFLFNRVSTKMEEQETSLDQQEEQSYAYAKRNGLHVAYNFRVQETGSKEEERHVFNQMITLLKSELIDIKHVIFKSADRSSRNRHDKGQLDKLRKKHGVTIHYYGSGRVLHGQSHYTEELQDDIENLFATHFARELSHKIRAANEYKAFEKKQAPTKTAPYGYFWDRNTREHKIDRKVEERVRVIFDAFDESTFSLTQFAKHCNEKGWLPISGTPWSKGRMQKFLTNPFYCGWFRYKGGIYEGIHEGYFPRERYDARLERLKSNRNGSLSGRRTHLLSKYLKCAKCGQSYIAEAQTGANDSGNYVYYKHACRSSDSEHRVREADVLASITQTVEANRFSDEFSDSLKSLFADVLTKGHNGHRKDIQRLLAQIEQLNQRKSKLYDLFTIEEIDKLELVTKRREYDNQLGLLKQQRSGHPCPRCSATSCRGVESAGPGSRASPQQNRRSHRPPARAAHGLPCPSQPADVLSVCSPALPQNRPARKIEILKTMAADLSLSPESQLAIRWSKPYNLLTSFSPSKETEVEIQAGRARGGCEEATNHSAAAKKDAGGPEKLRKRKAPGLALSKQGERGFRGMSHRVEGHRDDDEFNPVSRERLWAVAKAAKSGFARERSRCAQERT